MNVSLSCNSNGRRCSAAVAIVAGMMRANSWFSLVLSLGMARQKLTVAVGSARMKSRGFNFFPRPRFCSISLSQRAILPHFTFRRPRWPPTQYARTTDRKIANASPFSVRPPPPFSFHLSLSFSSLFLFYTRLFIWNHNFFSQSINRA